MPAAAAASSSLPRRDISLNVIARCYESLARTIPNSFQTFNETQTTAISGVVSVPRRIMVVQRNNIHFAIHHGAVMSHGVYPVKWIQSTQYGRRTDASERARVTRAERKRSRIERESLALVGYREVKSARARGRPDRDDTVIMLHALTEEIAHNVTPRAIERHSACSLR